MLIKEKSRKIIEGVRIFLMSLKEPQRFFVTVALVFGGIFIFLFPPFQFIDEPTHFYRAYQIAQGELIGAKQGSLTGGYLPSGVIHILDPFGRIVNNYRQKAYPGDILKEFAQPYRPDVKEFVAFNNTVIYPPATYLPQVVGVTAARVLHTPPIAAFYFARIANLIFYVVLLYWAIRLLPIGKWTVALVGLLPMMLTQAASVSSDSVINAVTIFTIAVIGALILRVTVSPKRLLGVLLGCALFLSLVKIPTMVVLLLVLAVPKERFKYFKGRAIYFLLLGVVALLPALLWSYFILKLRVELRPDTSVVQQIHFVMSRPLSVIKTFVLYPLQARFDQTVAQLYGWLGWNEIKLPLWLALIHFFLILLSLFDPDRRAGRITKWMRLIALVTGIVAIMCISFLLFLSWIPVGYPMLYDMWGRYYVPFLTLLVFAGGLFSLSPRSWNRAVLAIRIVIPLTLALTIVLIWNRYYYVLPLG